MSSEITSIVNSVFGKRKRSPKLVLGRKVLDALASKGGEASIQDIVHISNLPKSIVEYSLDTLEKDQKIKVERNGLTIVSKI